MHSDDAISKFGSLMFIIAGILFFVANLLIIILPDPPASEVEFFEWLSANRLIISFQNEILFFAALSLIPAVYVLYQSQRNQLSRSSIFGIGLMVVAIPVLSMLDIVEGRLVYPVYGIKLSFDVLKLVLSIYHGGMHAVSIIFAISIVLISYAMKKSLSNNYHWYLGIVNGVLLIVGSYPWLTGIMFNLVVALAFLAWMVLTGAIIYQKIRSGEFRQFLQSTS